MNFQRSITTRRIELLKNINKKIILNNGWIRNNPNGELGRSIIYLNGKLGRLRNYSNGKLCSKSINYPNGKVGRSINYLNGKLGRSIIYPNGKWTLISFLSLMRLLLCL
jgi:antitoxin component YwqK of YwqJK toxin-antitoxin module